MTSAPESAYYLMQEISLRYLQEFRQEIEEMLRHNNEAFATKHLVYNGDLPKILRAPAMPEGEIMLVAGNQLGKSTVKMLWLDEAADLQKILNAQDSSFLDAMKYMGEPRIVPIIQPEKKKVDTFSDSARRAHQLMYEADTFEMEASRAKTFARIEEYMEEAAKLRRRANEIRRTGNPHAKLPQPLKTQAQEEIERLERSVQTYRLDAESQRAQVKSLKAEITKIQDQHDRMRGSLPTQEVDRPGTLSALQRMETDLGKLRKFLGTDKFEAILTGKVVVREAPEPRGRWDWNEMRRMR